MFPKIDPTTTKSWASLSALAKNNSRNIQELFKNSNRFDEFSFQIEDLFFDFSKNDLTKEVFDTLISLAQECRLGEAIKAQFAGEAINETENRAVLHTALRKFSTKESDQNILIELDKIKSFSEKLLNGEWLGYTGKRITDIVNIGIGGSDLGPKMVSNALRNKWSSITPHFISNVDAAQLEEELDGLDPETSVFIIASKTFTTQETMANADTAKKWFLSQGGSDENISNHFVAVSTNTEEVQNFGIDPANMFVFWDWVGGRYSLWSSIGLSIACSAGYEAFEELLKGAHQMDEHFTKSDFECNMPVIAALVGIWYNNFLGYESLAILPYDHRLRYLPAYLQQADMESNGKHVDRNGAKLNYQSGPVIWGEPGTNGQHAFYQLIHQGTKVIPTEFIAFARPDHSHQNHHEKLLANFFAQTEALLHGKTEEQVQKEMGENLNETLVPFKVFEGNRPSTSILIKELNAFNLGMLIAYYEHKIFVQGVIWNIFSFDQWGVELGKQLAKPILREIQENSAGNHDSSTSGLMGKYHDWRR